jgi:hypothetical protein
VGKIKPVTFKVKHHHFFRDKYSLMSGKALSKFKKRACNHKDQDKRLYNAASLWKKEIQCWEREVKDR